MIEKTDIELVKLSQSGDKEAFGLLAQRYHMLVRSIARRFISDEESSRDLAQEALLQAYLSIHKLREPALFKGWICGITANVCRSFLRDQKVVFFSYEAMAGGLSFDAIPLLTMETTPEKMAEESELHRTIIDAISCLSPIDREVTLLFYYDELSLREVASLLGISVGAAKVRLYRARRQLGFSLKSQDPEIIEIDKRRNVMIPVTIADVVKKELTDSQGRVFINHVIVLHDEAGQRALLVWVGLFEGESIVMGLGKLHTPRPLTFEFLANILKAVEVQVEQVRVESLKDNTFYGVLRIKCNERVIELDARPSDALALAVRTGSPIFVSEEVFEKAGVDIPRKAKLPNRKGTEQILKEFREIQNRVPVQQGTPCPRKI
jgi:RNA polymerase sigma factor (sigma-70 family)